MKKKLTLKDYDTSWNIFKKILKEFIVQTHPNESRQELLLKYMAEEGFDDDLLLDLAVDIETFYRYFEDYILEHMDKLTAFTWRKFKPFKWYKKYLCKFALDETAQEMYRDLYEEP